MDTIESNYDISVETPKDFNNYSEYVQFCVANNVNNYLSESEFADRKNPNFKASIPMAFTTAAGNLILKNSGKIIESLAKGGARGAATAALDALKSEGLSAARDFVIKQSGSDGGGSNGKSGDSPSGYGGMTGASSNLRGVYDVNPLSIELRPNLPAAVYSDTVNFPSNRSSFCHISGFKVGFDLLDTATRFYFDNVLVPQLQNRAQMMVGFRVDMTLLTPSKLIAYFNALFDLLSVYYFMTGVISYCNVPTNKDRGMFALRAMISAKDIDMLEQIRDMMRAYPVPPNLNSLVFWLYQTYTDGPNGNIIIKAMPIGFNPTTAASSNTATGFTGTDSAVLSGLITSLNTPDNINISSMLTRITPSWVMPKIMDPSPIPIYSSGFSTLFANMQHTYMSVGVQYFGPNLTSDSGSAFYISLDEVLDGLVLGLSSFYNATSTSFRPALGRAANTVTEDAGSKLCNRWSYIYSTSLNEYLWRPSNNAIESAFGRPELAKAYNATSYYALLPNSILVKGVTPEIVRESSKSICAWLMSMDTIKSQKKQYNNSGSGNKPKFNSNKSKPKAEKKSEAPSATEEVQA